MAVVFVVASPEMMQMQMDPSGAWAFSHQQLQAVPDQMACSGYWGYNDGYNLDYSHQTSTYRQAPVEKTKNGRASEKKNRKAEENAWVQLPTNEWSTICFRNVPNIYSNTTILELLDVNGFKDAYDFVYVPHDFKRLPLLANLGYFFVNFVSNDAALRAWETFDSFNDWEPANYKVLAPTWATNTQGLQACIEKYSKSPVMHPDVPFECKPLLVENGKAVQLAPSKDHIKAPRSKTATPTTYQTYHGHLTAGTPETATDIVNNASQCVEATASGSSTVPKATASGSSTTIDSGSDGDATSNSGGDTTSTSVVEHPTQMTPNIGMMSYDDADSCLRCDMVFTCLRHRHHCSACGMIYCAECAPHTNKDRPNVSFERAEAVLYQRLCLDCANGMQEQNNDESMLVVKNTFLTLSSIADAECDDNINRRYSL